MVTPCSHLWSKLPWLLEDQTTVIPQGFGERIDTCMLREVRDDTEPEVGNRSVLTSKDEGGDVFA